MGGGAVVSLKLISLLIEFLAQQPLDIWLFSKNTFNIKNHFVKFKKRFLKIIYKYLNDYYSKNIFFIIEYKYY